jgi:tight adherence protein C
MMESVLAPALASAAAASLALAAAWRADPVVRTGLGPALDAQPSRAPDILGWVGSRRALLRLARPERLAGRLAEAGSDRGVEQVAGEKWLAAVIGGVVALRLPWPAPMLAPVVSIAGFLLPEFALGREARRRRARADRELPLLLDLLAAASAAGLSGQIALRRAVEATEGPLAEELQVALRRVDLGGRWRDELEEVAHRLAVPDLGRAVAVLTRSGTLGSSLADGLSQLAHESRESRRALVAERARKAPVKMLFPLVFLVLPAFLLLTVVPVLVTTLQSIR